MKSVALDEKRGTGGARRAEPGTLRSSGKAARRLYQCRLVSYPPERKGSETRAHLAAKSANSCHDRQTVCGSWSPARLIWPRLWRARRGAGSSGLAVGTTRHANSHCLLAVLEKCGTDTAAIDANGLTGVEKKSDEAAVECETSPELWKKSKLASAHDAPDGELNVEGNGDGPRLVGDGPEGTPPVSVHLHGVDGIEGVPGCISRSSNERANAEKSGKPIAIADYPLWMVSFTTPCEIE